MAQVPIYEESWQAWLRGLLRSYRVTNKALATRMGKHESQVSLWLNGVRSPDLPNLRTLLLAVAAETELSFATLLEEVQGRWPGGWTPGDLPKASELSRWTRSSAA